MIPPKISFWHESFHNDFIPVVALDQSTGSGTKLGRYTFHNYHIREVSVCNQSASDAGYLIRASVKVLRT